MANIIEKQKIWRIRHRFDTAENWKKSNIRLKSGELAFDNYGNFKVGLDTEKTWNEYQNFIISLKNNQGVYINYSKGKKTFYRCQDKQYIYIENAELNEIQNVSSSCNSIEN